MPHQPLAAVVAAAADTGSHPGAAYYAYIAVVIGAVIGVPIYVVRLVRGRRGRR